MALQLMQRTGQRVGVVSEEGRVLGRREGQLRVEQHARGDAAVQAQMIRGYEVGRVSRVEARYWRVEVRQKRRVKGRPNRHVRSGPVRAVVASEATGAAAFGARRLAAVASVAHGSPIVAVARPRAVMGRMGCVWTHDVQQLIVVVEVVVARVRRATFVW